MKITQDQRIHLEDLHLKLWGDIVRLLKAKSLWYLKHYFIPEYAGDSEFLIGYVKASLLFNSHNYGYNHRPKNCCFLCELSLAPAATRHDIVSWVQMVIKDSIVNEVDYRQCQYFKIKCNDGNSTWSRLYQALIVDQNRSLAIEIATEIRDVVIRKIG